MKPANDQCATLKDMLDALTKQLNNGDLSQLTAENAKKFADLMRMVKEEEAKAVLKTTAKPEMTAICVRNLGMEDRFDEGVSYFVERLPDPDMLLATDMRGEKVEVMKERFRVDDLKPTENKATDEREVRGYNAKVSLELRLKAIDARINELLAVVGKYDKLKNPDKIKEYRDALEAMDPLLNERDRLEARQQRAKAPMPVSEKSRCETCVKWQNSGSKTAGLGVCTSHHSEHSNRSVHWRGLCGLYQPRIEEDQP